jgi:hypothetical protein
LTIADTAFITGKRKGEMSTATGSAYLDLASTKFLYAYYRKCDTF